MPCCCVVVVRGLLDVLCCCDDEDLLIVIVDCCLFWACDVVDADDDVAVVAFGVNLLPVDVVFVVDDEFVLDDAPIDE